MKFLGKELDTPNSYPFIVAEISCNHEGSIKQGKRLIQAAKEAGADAVKIQVYTADDMTLRQIKYQIESGLWKGRTLYELYEKTQTNLDMAEQLIVYAEKIGIPIFASVFSGAKFEWCIKKGIEAFKIASFELTDVELIKLVAGTGRPVVLSTGMASTKDIDLALNYCNLDKTILLHCISAYPTKLSHANLWRIKFLQEMYKGWSSSGHVFVGFSDHTRGLTAGPLAVSLGACMLEKHLALPETNPEDESFSLHPNEFRDYVRRARIAAEACFNVKVPEEDPSYKLRRRLYVADDVAEGELLTPDNIRSVRGPEGLEPYEFLLYPGRRYAALDLKAGEPLTIELIK